MPNIRVVTTDTNNLSADGYRKIVDGIITNSTGFSKFETAAETGNTGQTRPDIIQGLARSAGAVAMVPDPASTDGSVISGRNTRIKSEKNGNEGNKSRVVVPLPESFIPVGQLAYLNDYLTLLISELNAAGGISGDAAHGYKFNPLGAGVPGVHKMLFGIMMLTKCR